ncbi:MAG: rod shape-determining protein RodA [Bacteroidetes bacterium]|nr:rod shape-determining protein RodA [Bacteroidota bacterium]
MRIRESTFYNIDWLTVFIYLLLIFIGWINIYSAVYDEAHQNIFDVSQRYGKQLIWIGASIVISFILLMIDSKLFLTFSYLIYILSLLSLIAVLLIGTKIAGSRSWFQIGEFALQPSEFAKFATALALTRFLSGLNRSLLNFKDLIISATIIAVPALLILMQPDTGSALVYFAFMIVLYREGLSAKFILIGLLAIILFLATLLLNKYLVIAIYFGFIFIFYLKNFRLKGSLPILIIVLTLGSAYVYSVDYVFENIFEPHQKKRINVLIGKESDPKGAGYNVNQSKIAIGSGGFSGKGYLKGTQTKFNFVPEQSTDFIFCTIGEEWGLVGSSMVIILFLSLFSRLIILAERQRSVYSRIYGYSVASILFFHFIVNIGMTIGLAPVIGIPLPFISYGGSSLWSFTILLFIFIRQDASRLEIL